ncbi:lysylphosphatidylglycerol synthase domain-containing protein [Gaopeijia maritima]|uniref:lysylphosphatidylglycerol synthase domain-containing protein n=1 Tax=Gaopeijia maritima TaxID=3119007 RepID=UPI003290ABD1
MRKTVLRAAGATVSLGIALAIPVVLARRADLPVSALLALPLAAHLLAALALFVEVGGRAARIVVFARALKVPLRWSTAWIAQLAGDSAGTVTPSRSGTEPAKMLAMRRDGGKVGGLAAIAVGETAFEALGLLAIGLALAVFVDGGGAIALAIGTYAGVVLTVIAGLLLFAGQGAQRRPVPRWWTKVGLRHGRWRLLERTSRDFRERAGALRHIPRRYVAGAVGATFLHQAARAATFPALVWATTMEPGLDWVALTLRPFGLLYLGSLLPPPGGGGGIEMGFVAVLGDALGPDQLPVLLLWWRVYTHLLTAVIGAGLLLQLWAGRARARSAREREQFPESLDREESVEREPAALHSPDGPGPA